jgi:Fe-Mn family superoxide dismutase
MKKLIAYINIIVAFGIPTRALTVSQKQAKKMIAVKKGTKFVLPDLPYKYSALEPDIDTKTMKLHHDKHHRQYVEALNKALEDYPELQELTLEELVTNWQDMPEKITTAVRNNAGGHLNHSLFWHWLTPHSTSSALRDDKELFSDITNTFGGLQDLKKQLLDAATKVFGSGWAWLALDEDNKLVIVTTKNQDNPLTDGLRPILGLDVWEHAYYLKYNNRRPDYLNSLWNRINWMNVSNEYWKYKLDPEYRIN